MLELHCNAESTSMKNVLTYFLLGAILLILNSCSLLHREVVRATPNTAQSQICGKCHVKEYREWQQSAHRNSYISDDFKEQSDSYGDEECLTCHVPNPIYGAEELTARNHNLNEGINCVTCHLTPEQKIAGPLSVFPAHATNMNDPFYRRSALCGTCHDEHFEQWEQTMELINQSNPKKTILSCQECHMPQIRRKLITQGFFQYVHQEHEARKHTFTGSPAPNNKRDSWLLIETEVLSETNAKWPVRIIVSHDIPHALPAVYFGFKEIDFFVSLKSLDGQILDEQVLTFSSEYDEYIAPNKKSKYDFYFPSSIKAQTEFLEIEVKRSTNNVDSDDKIIYFNKRRIHHVSSDFDPDDIIDTLKEAVADTHETPEETLQSSY